jgi:hypothetical protein
MSSFVPALRSFVDVDSPAWRADRSAREWDDVAPDTARSPGIGPHGGAAAPLYATGADAADDDEPATLRSDEIRAASPRAARTFDPADYVIDDASCAPGFYEGSGAHASPRPPYDSGIVPCGSEPSSGDAQEERVVFVSISDRLRGLACKLGLAVDRFVAA